MQEQDNFETLEAAGTVEEAAEAIEEEAVVSDTGEELAREFRAEADEGDVDAAESVPKVKKLFTLNFALPLEDYLDFYRIMNTANVKKSKKKMTIMGAVEIVVGLLLVLSPLMLVVALLVKLTSPGPVFYRQERVGLNRRPFLMYKFRSMKAEQNGADKTAWSTREDDRRTAFGSWMRKYSVDELPQLWNVLRGDMSLVGPRPEIPYFVEKFKEEVPLYMLKHLVRPGITGLAQIRGWRGDTSIVERIKCDIDYIEHWTFLLDIKILLLTLTRGVVNRSE